MWSGNTPEKPQPDCHWPIGARPNEEDAVVCEVLAGHSLHLKSLLSSRNMREVIDLLADGKSVTTLVD